MALPISFGTYLHMFAIHLPRRVDGIYHLRLWDDFWPLWQTQWWAIWACRLAGLKKTGIDGIVLFQTTDQSPSSKITEIWRSISLNYGKCAIYYDRDIFQLYRIDGHWFDSKHHYIIAMKKQNWNLNHFPMDLPMVLDIILEIGS